MSLFTASRTSPNYDWAPGEFFQLLNKVFFLRIMPFFLPVMKVFANSTHNLEKSRWTSWIIPSHWYYRNWKKSFVRSEVWLQAMAMKKWRLGMKHDTTQPIAQQHSWGNGTDNVYYSAYCFATFSEQVLVAFLVTFSAFSLSFLKFRKEIKYVICEPALGNLSFVWAAIASETFFPCMARPENWSFSMFAVFSKLTPVYSLSQVFRLN